MKFFALTLLVGLATPTSAIYADQKNKYDSVYPSISPSPPLTLDFLDKSTFLVTSAEGLTAVNIDTGARLWSHPLPSPKIEVTPSGVKVSSDSSNYVLDKEGRLSPSTSKPKPSSSPPLASTAPPPLPSVSLPPSASIVLSATSGSTTVECLNVHLCYAFTPESHLWTTYDFFSAEVEDIKVKDEKVKVISKTKDGIYAEYTLDTSTQNVAIKTLDYISAPVSKIRFNDRCEILAHSKTTAYCSGQGTEFTQPILSCYTSAVCVYESDVEGRIEQISLVTPNHSGEEIAHVMDDKGIRTYINNTMSSSYTLSKSEELIDYYQANPDEKVSSKVHVTGEDGLLVKHSGNYVAIATKISESLDAFSVTTSPKKPAGVEPTTTSQPTKSKPTLAITLYDVTSGKVLHRQTHTSSKLIDLIITDNWTIYLLYNPSTGRTEISVICLFSGLIPKDGIGIFHSSGVPKKSGPETIWSRENPIALQRIYTLPKPCTSLTVGLSRFGIVPKSIFLTLQAGGIWSIDLRMLDPRRPSGDPNLGEKKEGLTKYDPIVPFVPTMVASTDRPLDVTKIITSPKELESTIVIFGTGGGGGYFVKYKGRQRFDELPEEFNRMALIGGVGVLFTIWMVGRGYAKKKAVNMAWA
ncbi:hypothetical protein TrST_g12739 [Triparma strigata]|uniref:ER membrane protein complex subunit 1 n=1 Tax=Triparma strigata TaxID=1606541 RepID=A0A9W7EIJ6_9STRA|nr:hypothetical protein TrST_g12739 [Triparma strigata]